MTQITVNEDFQPNKYLLISRVDETQSIQTTRVLITDENTNLIRVVNIEQGPQGFKGDKGDRGLPGQDAPTFDVLPVNSGGTNNTTYTSGNIIFYDGDKLASSSYTVQEILDTAGSSNNVTGVLAGSGLQKTDSNNTVTLDTLLGEGLTIGSNNEITVDNTIARTTELDLGTIQGQVPISKGGTNNNFFTQNRILYFDGTKILSSPIATGNVLQNGISVDIVAGSGLVGGGSLNIPNGTVAIHIPSSADIIVEDNLINLSTTGTPGTYSKVITDDKGRVVSGTTLTASDVIEILGYTPFHPGNDGEGSTLDADLLDGQHGYYYTDAVNLTGILNPDVLPSAVVPGQYTKIGVDANGLVSGVLYADQSDIISSLGYTPVPISGNKIISGPTTIDGEVTLNGELSVYDNLPLLATNNANILPDAPRGVSFIYGGLFSNKTGILAYYPANDELKLVTNVFASGADTDAGGNQDDLNGGDAESVFILQNLDGDASTVLLRTVADGLYVKLAGDEEIGGQKVFVDNIIFRKQIRIDDPVGNTLPPFNVSTNTGLVGNLNVDLLDGNHGSYYRNAANMTGAFSYNNVTFDHIQGTNRYIPKYNDSVNDPANRIDDSIIYQDNNDNIKLTNDHNLTVGNGTVNNASASVSIGQGHVIDGNNNLVVGENNAVTGNNSVVLNTNSKSKANNSVALGDYGFAYSPNQIAFGAFNYHDPSTFQRLEHGQQTTVTMHLQGIQPGQSWTSLTPTITIPNNKTFAYNLELLITKAFGTGVAQFNFASGIFKNATYRDSNNFTQVVNTTTHPQVAKKVEIFNNSQIKNHYHTFENTNGQRQLQDVKVTHLPIKSNSLTTQNVDDFYLYTKENVETTGFYYKNNRGDLILDINEPRYSGNFETDLSSRGIKIVSPDHGVQVGSEVNLEFSHVTGLPLADKAYKVYSVVSKDVFYVERPFYTGILNYYSNGQNGTYAEIILNNDSIAEIDNSFLGPFDVDRNGNPLNCAVTGEATGPHSGVCFNTIWRFVTTSGNINTNGNITSLSDDHIFKYLKVNSEVVVQSGDYFFNRIVESFNNNSITLNDPIATGEVADGHQTIKLTGPIRIGQVDYSFSEFKRSPKLYVETPNDGTQFINTRLDSTSGNFQSPYQFSKPPTGLWYSPVGWNYVNTGNYPIDFNQNSNTKLRLDYTYWYSTGNWRDLVDKPTTIAITGLDVPTRQVNNSGLIVQLLPLLENSGTVHLSHKKALDGNFQWDKTQFNKYSCVYRKEKNESGNDQLFVYYTDIDKPINISHQPVQYSLCAGYLDDDNESFQIINDKDRFHLVARNPLDYESKNIYNIRIRATDYAKDKFLEKNFTITVNNIPNELPAIPNPDFPYSHIDIPDQTVDISETFNYTIPEDVFNDPNQEVLTFTASQQNGHALPSWLSFNASTRTFTGSPDGCDLGTYNIRVHASNTLASIFQDFFLVVTDNIYQVFDYVKSTDDSITDIVLSTTSIDENLPSGSIVTTLDCVGSYKPYLDFHSASNTFSGIFTRDSDFVECFDDVVNYPAVSVTGSSRLVELGSSLTVLNETYNLINKYPPFALSGTIGLTDGKIYLVGPRKNYENTFNSGMTIDFSGNQNLPRSAIISAYNDHSIELIRVDGRDAKTYKLVEETQHPTCRTKIDTQDGYEIYVEPLGWLDEGILSKETSEDLVTTQNEDPIRLTDPLTVNTTWASGYPECVDGDLIENNLITYQDYSNPNVQTVDTSQLDNFNPPPLHDLKRSNIKYHSDQWSFGDDIENPIIAFYGLGSGEFCRFKTEDDNILNVENNDRIISNNQKDHGTRIEINSDYEIFDSTCDVVKCNGKLMQNNIDSIVCENNEPLVHDYAISARSGDGCLVFLGKRSRDEIFKFTYEASTDLTDNVYNYHYNWGRLLQIQFFNDRQFIRLDRPYESFGGLKKAHYDEVPLEEDNYSISGLKMHSYPNNVKDTCDIVYISGIHGFESDNTPTGNYVTGMLDLYAEAGTGVINLNFNKDINLDDRNKHNIYLSNFSSPNNDLDLPVVGQYKDITIVDSDSLQINNTFFMPDSGVQISSANSRTGTFSSNINKGHGYIEEMNTIINRVPIEFNNIYKKWHIEDHLVVDSTANRRPRDYVFDVVSVTGNRISVKDDKNYFLKEVGRADYYDHSIKAEYRTNGITFSGSLFNNHKNIYDIRYDLKNFNYIYDKLPFKYEHATNNFSFTAKSGVVNPFDNLVVSFPTGFSYSSDPINVLIDQNMLVPQTGLLDTEPNKDMVLLESSKAYGNTTLVENISFTGIMSVGRDAQGTCNINNNLTNRLQSGLLLNYNDSDRYGYEVDSIVDGFTFTGVIPKNHNVISTNITGEIDINHIGHASIFGTGRNVFYTGTRILREATSGDIGYTEYYCIDTNIDNLSPTTGISGVGSLSNPFYYDIKSRDQDNYLEFIYLGQNSNAIRLKGSYSISGAQLLIYKTTFEEQVERHRDYINLRTPIADSLIFSDQNAPSGSPRLHKNLDLTLDVKRFDKIKIRVNNNDETAEHFDNNFLLKTQVLNNVTIKPYILDQDMILNTGTDYYPYINPQEPELVYTPVPTLDSNDCIDCDTQLPQYIPSIDPNYSVLLKHDWHILPYIKTNNFYCDIDRKNEQVFFNGNILTMSKFNTIKPFLLKDDEFIIDKFNNINISDSGVTKHVSKFNPTNQTSLVSGISIEGPRSIPPRVGSMRWHLLYENAYRHQMPLGVSHNAALPNKGTISFTKTTSGSMNVLDYNNIHYHTYGGTTSHYPLDNQGRFVQPPQTGTYKVAFDVDTCMSGTLCVRISGLTEAAYTGVSPGQTMFFDFDDEAPSLTQSYSITDLLSPNCLTINPPFDQQLIGKSGLVYIIDSTQHIKGNLNPNLNNGLTQSNGVMQGLSSTNKKIFDYYDHDSKRWKHTVHFLGEQPALTGYDISLSSRASRFYSINDQKIKIDKIQYTFDDLNSFQDLGSSLSIPDNVGEVTFKITTLNGDQSLFDIQRYSVPTVSMSGITIYSAEFNQPGYFGWHGSGWDLGIVWRPPKEDYTNKNVVLRVSDLTGDTDNLFSISKYKIPEITSFYPTGYVASGSKWQVGFDITKLDVDTELQNGDLFIQLDNAPDPNNFQKFHQDAKSVMFSGDTTGAETGIYNLQLTVKDISTTPYVTLGIATGVLSVLDHMANRPSYNVEFNNMETTYYIDLDAQNQVKFDIPADLGPVPSEVTNNFNITFNTSDKYSLNLDSAGYNYDTDRFEIIATPKTTGTSPVFVNTSNRFVNQSVTVSIKQPVYDEFGGYTYQTYNRNIGFNIVFYRPVVIEPIPQSYIIPFTTNEPWQMEFYVKSGISEHNASSRPNASIFHSPGLGSYDFETPQYNLTYDYDSTLKKWKVTAVGNKDALGRYVAETGLYPISIYSDDAYSSSISNDDYMIKYNSFTRMKNISPDVYTTPNNEFYTKADIFDVNENASNSISFPGALKESSISILSNKLVRKYDRDLQLWTNSYASEKMTDKYDARVDFNGSTISVDCKSIGRDKIMAVAKFNTIEIESNELDGIPLKITGIVGWSNAPDAAIDVEQGRESWELQFKTIGGLAHANYPPTILLADMPTFCTGYNPLIETQLQCLVSPPSWNPNDQGGSWSYHFSGLPSCILLGRKDFSITAIDTDTSLLPSSPYLPNTDQVDFAFNYTEGTFDTNPPTVTVSPNYEGMDKMLPFCNTYYTKQLDFGPGEPALCTNVTGIKSYRVEGSVPPGLSFSQYFPEDTNFPIAPYSNMNSGYVRVEGYPTTFASGQAYAEKLTVFVTDARDKTASGTITFTDASVANEPDAAVTLYFKNDKIALSPHSGLKKVKGGSTQGWRPLPTAESLQCLSILPHNKCGNSFVTFSGLPEANALQIYLIQREDTPNESRFSAGNTIYIGFDADNVDNDQTYIVHNDDIGLHVTGLVSLQSNTQTAPITGTATVVKGKRASIDLNLDNLFEGNIVDSTTNCILGGGSAKPDQVQGGGGGNDTERGLLGAMLPTFQASLTGLSPFTDFENLRLDRINPNEEIVSSVRWSDCYQTGIFRVSGIAVPPINVEIVDPPPAQDYFFSFNGIRFALATRLAYGQTETQRLLPQNSRSASLAYKIHDLMSGVVLQQGSVGAGSSFDTDTLTRDSGTVYKITISKDSDTFPTYNSNATPEASNEYIFLHKGDNLSTVPTQTTYPPVLTVGFDEISVTNSLTDLDPNGVVMDPIVGIAIGGYVPTDDGIGASIPYSHSGDGFVSGVYSSADFLPKISGIIQKNLTKASLTGLASSYTESNNNLTISDVNPSVGDIVRLSFVHQPNYGSPISYSDTITVASENIDGNSLTLTTTSPITDNNLNGTSSVDFLALIHEINLDDNEMIISGSLTYSSDGIGFQQSIISTGDSIGVDINNFVSTELNLLKENGFVSVVSGEGDLLYLGNTNVATGWLTGFGEGDSVKLAQNIDDNIKIMPYNTIFNTEGKYTFQITGRSNTRENEDLIYKIATTENPDMPVFDSATYPHVNITPKSHFQNYTLHVNKPLAIMTETVSKVGDELTFSISGGKRPLYSNTPDVQIAAGINGDYGYCGFYRHTTGTAETIVDEYNATNDTLSVRLTLSSNYGIDWSVHNTVKIKISDETGTDNYTYVY